MEVLIIDSDRNILRTTSGLIELSGHKPYTAISLSQAEKVFDEEDIDLVFLDRIVGGKDTLPYMKHLLEENESRPVVIFTDQSSVQSAVKFVRNGACAYLEKPFLAEQIQSLLDKLKKEISDSRRLEQLQIELENSQPSIILESKNEATQYAYDIAFKASKSEASILLLGESGNGKSILARQIHERSHRSAKPFITLSCPSLSKDLLESELFGHAKGAFTGALKDHWGKVHAADGGTLFLDEIGELPIEIQPKLLRLLQEQQYERLGETRIRQADVRVVAATNRDLNKEVAEGNFREDLLYRLNVITITIPPLRSRKEDLELLADNFFDYYKRRQGRQSLTFTHSAIDAIMGYNWPGNLRELGNAIERSVILAEGQTLTAEDLGLKDSLDLDPQIRVGGHVTVKELEEMHIRMVLEKAESIEAAANILGIDTATLYRKRRKMGLV